MKPRLTPQREAEIKYGLKLGRSVGLDHNDPVIEEVEGAVHDLLTELDAVRAELAVARRPQVTVVEQVDCPNCGYQQGLP